MPWPPRGESLPPGAGGAAAGTRPCARWRAGGRPRRPGGRRRHPGAARGPGFRRRAAAWRRPRPAAIGL
ncbi:MAG: hypothetical protein EON47_14140 [Acetobacteraceae bacterium]|nr:MAG: hypothetical protein EON47_14140 [Acetobacteraceae bacterium]